MTSERTYRDSISREDALKEILDNAGTQFSSELVKVFEEHFAGITAK
jgi:HD-GYP domain-containing protein (c-di-GMP phosphodiesterase class II)